MRLITDEQHAQIVEAVKLANSYFNAHDSDDGDEALATLQALPEVVQAVDTNNGDFEGDVYISRSAGWIDDYFKRYSTLKLYATKETS